MQRREIYVHMYMELITRGSFMPCFLRWVKTCREKYHGSKANLTPLTDDQKTQLEAIGFEWRPGGSQSNEETWHNMFDQLRAYADEHGDCKVPQKKGKLGGWCDRQRKRYRATMQAREFWAQHPGQKAPSLVHNTEITDDQIAALDSIGFVWSLRERTGSNSSKRNPDATTVATQQQHHVTIAYHYNQHHVQQQPQQLPHHQGGVMMSAPEDEAASRSLLYFQGGRGLADAATMAGGSGFAVAAHRNGMMPQDQQQQHQQHPQPYDYVQGAAAGFSLNAAAGHPQQDYTGGPPVNNNNNTDMNNGAFVGYHLHHNGHAYTGAPTGYAAAGNNTFDGTFHHHV